MELDQTRIEDAIVREVADRMIGDDALYNRVKNAVDARIDRHFKDTADAQIQAAIEVAVSKGFEHEYCRVDSFGKREGAPTTIRAQLEKMIAEYWANGPHTETPPGHWCLFAQYVSSRDGHALDDDVKMFFAMTNAVFDAGIAAWDTKRVLDSVRPVTAIPYQFQGQQIQSWGGPYQGTVTMDGSQWIPYQPSTFPTPPFPEYISGHSTFSAAGATVLALWTGSDHFGDSVTFAPGSSTIEPGLTPHNPVTLQWGTFSDAANEAGISRRYGGIHFKAGDLVGRAVGDLVGIQAWAKAQYYFNGH